MKGPILEPKLGPLQEAHGAGSASVCVVISECLVFHGVEI